MSNSEYLFWIPIYIGDILSSTQHLTNEQFGLLHKFLYHQWDHGHFSEEEMVVIAGFSGSLLEDISGSASSSAQALLKQVASRCLAPVKQLLSQDAAGLWFSRRCDLEKAQAVENKKVLFERAQKGGRAKERKRRERLEKITASSSAQAVLRQDVSSAQAVLEECPLPLPVSTKTKAPLQAPVAAGGSGSAPGLPEAPSQPPEAPPAIAADREPAAAVLKQESAVEGATARPDGQVGGNVQAGRVISLHPGTNAIEGHVNPGVGLPKTAPAPDGQESVDKAKFMAGPNGHFAAEVFRFWEGAAIKGYDLSWSNLEERAMNRLRRENPRLDVSRFKQLLRNRAASDGINRADPPRKWLRSLLKYADGPLDRFGKPLKPPRVH